MGKDRLYDNLIWLKVNLNIKWWKNPQRKSTMYCKLNLRVNLILLESLPYIANQSFGLEHLDQ